MWCNFLEHTANRRPVKGGEVRERDRLYPAYHRSLERSVGYARQRRQANLTAD